MRHTMIGVAWLASTLAVAGCTTIRETDATPTASQELLVTTAADRAVDQLDFKIPSGTKVFLDIADFEGDNGKYVVVWKRQRGAWKIAVDTWNTDAPAPRQ